MTIFCNIQTPMKVELTQRGIMLAGDSMETTVDYQADYEDILEDIADLMDEEVANGSFYAENWHMVATAIQKMVTRISFMAYERTRSPIASDSPLAPQPIKEGE